MHQHLVKARDAKELTGQNPAKVLRYKQEMRAEYVM